MFSPQLTPRNGAVPVVLARDDPRQRNLFRAGLVPQEGLEPPTLALRMLEPMFSAVICRSTGLSISLNSADSHVR